MSTPDPRAKSEPEQRVLAALDALGVEYEHIPIDADLADTAQFCERYGFPLEQSANTILIGTRSDPPRFAACVVLATTRLDVNRSVRKLMGTRKLSFAKPDDMVRVTRQEFGGVTAFALPEDLPIYVDEAVMACPWVIMGTGGRDSKVTLSPDVLTKLPGAKVVPGLAKPR